MDIFKKHKDCLLQAEYVGFCTGHPGCKLCGIEGNLISFKSVALGARFKYKDQDEIWIKLSSDGRGLVARYDPKYIKDPNWNGQTIAGAAETVEEAKNLKVIVIG